MGFDRDSGCMVHCDGACWVLALFWKIIVSYKGMKALYYSNWMLTSMNWFALCSWESLYFSVLFCHPCYVFGVPINLCTVLLKYHQRRNSDSHIRRYSFKTCTINSQELKLCICYLFFKMLHICPYYICGQIGQNTLHTTCQGLKYSNDRFIFTLYAYVFVRMCVHNVHAWCT